MKTKFIFSVLLLLATSMLFAQDYGYDYDFCVDDLYYRHIRELGKETGEVYVVGMARYYKADPTSVTIPSFVVYNNKTYTVKKIAISAFKECDELTSISIPNSVSSIGDSAFIKCSKLTSIRWNAVDCQVGEHCFDLDNNITSFTFGNEVENIPYSLCRDMTNLTSIEIPNNVKQIGASAFRGCEYLEEVTLGTGIKEIGYSAFEGDKRIYSVTCYAKVTPTIYKSTFDGVSSNAELYVPANVLKKYKVDEYWNKFTILPIQAEETENGTLNVRTTDTEAIITWPVNSNAENYTIVIKKENVSFCTLLFNSDGQLANITFAAPARVENANSPQAELTTEGYRFTVTGLDSGTDYAYSITTKDINDEILDSYEGTFKTKEGQTAINEIRNDNGSTIQKVLRDGQILIQNGEKVLNLIGMEL